MKPSPRAGSSNPPAPASADPAPDPEASDAAPAPDPLAWALLDQLGRPAALSEATGRLVAMNAAFRRHTQLGDQANPRAIRLARGRLWDDTGHALTPPGSVHSSGLLPRAARESGSAESRWRLVELTQRCTTLPDLARRLPRLRGGAALLQLELRPHPGRAAGLGLDQTATILDSLEERLLQTLPTGATLCRSRSERLVALFPWRDSGQALLQQARLWQQQLSAPLSLQPGAGQPALSLGLSRAPVNGRSLEPLLEASCQALAHAHLQPLPSVCLASHSSPSALSLQRLADPLAEAIAHDRLRLLYQPIVALASGRIEGVEVLCRWEDPQLGAIEPSLFIGVAEATEQIHLLGNWLIERVFAQLRRWQSLPAGVRYASLNVSPRQLQQPSLVDTLRRGLERHGLRAEQVMLEITEDQSIEPGSAAHDQLLELHRLGFCLAMDDYGRGYAGLHQLHCLPFSAVKVDRHLIDQIETDRLQQAMVQGAVDLQNTALMRVVVEGVERASQRQRLLELGCRLGQGFLFSRPVDAATIERLLRLPQLPEPGPAPTPLTAPEPTTAEAQAPEAARGPIPGSGP